MQLNAPLRGEWYQWYDLEYMKGIHFIIHIIRNFAVSHPEPFSWKGDASVPQSSARVQVTPLLINHSVFFGGHNCVISRTLCQIRKCCGLWLCLLILLESAIKCSCWTESRCLPFYCVILSAAAAAHSGPITVLSSYDVAFNVGDEKTLPCLTSGQPSVTR